MAPASKDANFRQRLGDVEVGRLRFRARSLASGLELGLHLSGQKGPGIEFLGYREYSPGDDLRHLDRRALLRHQRYLLREFQVETERALQLAVDLSASMDYAGPPPSPRTTGASSGTKAETARLLAATCALVARRSGDPVGLSIWTSNQESSVFLPPRTGTEQIAHILDLLDPDFSEGSVARGDKKAEGAALLETAGRLGRGTTVLWFSDFLDPLDTLQGNIELFAMRARTVIGVQILTRAELEFPFQGPVELVSPEGEVRVETDAERAREGYLRALDAHRQQLEALFSARKGALLQVTPESDLRTCLQEIVRVLQGGRD